MKKVLLAASLLLGSASVGAQRQPAQVVAGNARFTVVTPELIRMEWSADGKFEDRASLAFINRSLPAPDFKKKDGAKELTITTSALSLRYVKGERFDEKNLSVALALGKEKAMWRPGMRDAQNLKGTMRTLDRANGWVDSLLEQGIISRSGWALVDDSRSPLLTPDERWDYWVAQRDTAVQRQDWYFFGYGHDYKKALYDFTQVAGKIPMPPRFAFGYWWSRYWQYSDNELRDLVAFMKSLDIPLDVLIVDMDWHKTFGKTRVKAEQDAAKQRKGWTGYSWDRNAFPAPEQFFAWAKGEHLKTALNLHPASGIQPYEDVYDGFARAYGWDTAGRKYIPFTIEEKKWTNTYFDEVLHPFEKQGVDFWWLDWQQWLSNKSVAGLGNTFWLNHTFFTDMKSRGEARPMLFHRWGGLGNHRYQIGFSGDTHITWASLSFQPYFTATASNVGYGYWSHDIGGHMGGEVQNDPEMYLRWLQYGVFSPILRTHSTKSDAIERRIWMYPRHFAYMREAIQLRYRLAPYLYNAAREAYETGISICRPMYYDYPETELAYAQKTQYMFGSNILVSPVVQPADTAGLAQVNLWLPQGEWYEVSTGTTLTGGNTLTTRHFMLHEIPYYARAGSIIPMNHASVRSLQQRCDTLSLLFVPGASGELSYYEDDGATNAYDKEFARTTITKATATNGEELKITIAARQGQYKNMPASKAYELVIPANFPPVSVEINGEPATWTYDGFGLETKVLTPKLPCHKEAVITLRYSPRHVAQKQLLNNKVKLFRRLVPVTEAFKYINAHYAYPANLSEEYLSVSQTPSLITAHPEKTVEYLQHFEANFDGVLKQIEAFGDKHAAEVQRMLGMMKD
ncbi:MAG: glycoside hydrolase family 31 protein [Prevotellaceae bacterium]|jgi:alpha-glucosidase (family GH31 glycosyl hydrolase)|nr:glycoside hydrolase family 31 protein [Prevotellaceae bacterium]